MTGRSHRSVGIKRGFLTEAERTALLAYCQAPDTLWRQTSPDDPWHDRTIPHQTASPDISALLTGIRSRALALISGVFELDAPLYADSLALTRWRVGEDQRPHADGESLDGSPHPYPWRAYGAIIYLNTDFEGGELIFPALRLKPDLSDGMLAFFPGDRAFVHGVTPIRSGIRYTAAMFLTHDQSHADWA